MRTFIEIISIGAVLSAIASAIITAIAMKIATGISPINYLESKYVEIKLDYLFIIIRGAAAISLVGSAIANVFNLPAWLGLFGIVIAFKLRRVSYAPEHI
jgi:hypothetical protein